MLKLKIIQGFNVVKIRKDQTGFSAIEVLLILVVLGIAGFTGYFVWHATQNTNKSLTPDNSSTPAVKNKTTTPTNTQASNKVTLGGAHYSFSAPSDWKVSGGAPDDTYEDKASDVLVVEEDKSLGTPSADYVWEADSDTSNGIKIIGKSPACQPEHSSNFQAAYTTFKGLTYACNEDTSTTRIYVFVAVQGGEVPLGNYKYVINFNTPTKPNADFSGFEAILKTFKSK